MDFTGTGALVTGAGRGVGRAPARMDLRRVHGVAESRVGR